LPRRALKGGPPTEPAYSFIVLGLDLLLLLLLLPGRRFSLTWRWPLLLRQAQPGLRHVEQALACCL